MAENTWVTGVITLLKGVITLFITGRRSYKPIYNWFLGPPRMSLVKC